MAREYRLWDWLRDGLKFLGRDVHLVRVENSAGEGDPDIDVCWAGRSCGLELKGCDRPASPGTVLDIEVRQAQVLWHRRRWNAGGCVWLFIRVGHGRDVRRYLVPGSQSAVVKAGVTEEQLALMSELPSTCEPFQVLQRATVRSGFEPDPPTKREEK